MSALGDWSTLIGSSAAAMTHMLIGIFSTSVVQYIHHCLEGNTNIHWSTCQNQNCESIQQRYSNFLTCYKCTVILKNEWEVWPRVLQIWNRYISMDKLYLFKFLKEIKQFLSCRFHKDFCHKNWSVVLIQPHFPFFSQENMQKWIETIPFFKSAHLFSQIMWWSVTDNSCSSHGVLPNQDSHIS